MSHDVHWYSPAPLWSKWLENGHADHLRRPALLRFGTDDFMAALQSSLADGADAFEELQVPPPDADDGQNGTGVPMYQPAHERYYLVTASLVCREQGLPDRAVTTANAERACFVLRRLQPQSDGPTEVDGQRYAEYGWVTTSADENEEETAGKVWREIGPPSQVAEQEERFSMFPQAYEPTTPQARMKGPRRLWAGLIPVAQREEFETTPVAGEEGSLPESSPVDRPGTDLRDPRKTRFDTRVIQAFKNLRDNLRKSDSRAGAEDVRDPLLFAWLDLWQFLDTHLPDVAAAIQTGVSVENADFKKNVRSKQEVLRTLRTIEVQELGWGNTAADALRTVATHADSIEAGTFDNVPLPDLPMKNDSLNRAALADVLDEVLAPNQAGQSLAAKAPNLQTVVHRAVGERPDAESLPEDLQPPTTASVDGGLYVVRCLYERPNCPPGRRTTLGPPSRPFRMASFFDAQAPARDLNITLPGASVQDFREADQSVTMRFTKELRNQAERIQEVTLNQLQDGDAGSAPGVNIGMVCSLSIPIITICALMLLIIMVVLLNIVFWWLPFFKICFPLPSSN